ncbi:MAG: hypothetical protein HC853_17455 [Anaerolineae bacterium]|nr:hypothetical protein [Anaerolineae bacterium]
MVESSLGVSKYNPLTGRFLSADSIVPDGDNASIIPLTVDFHEPGFLAGVNGENALLIAQGWAGQDVKPRRGPMNPQQLNRFSYALGNPLRFTDPTGHDVTCATNGSACDGRIVVNNSTVDIYIHGEKVLADGRVVVATQVLKPGESSLQLGFADVDDVLIVVKKLMT